MSACGQRVWTYFYDVSLKRARIGEVTREELPVGVPLFLTPGAARDALRRHGGRLRKGTLRPWPQRAREPDMTAPEPRR